MKNNIKSLGLIILLFFSCCAEISAHFAYAAFPLRPNFHKNRHSSTKQPPIVKKSPTKISLHALANIAEKKYGIPENLLLAIAYVESKCHPYAVNARGRGYYFKSKKEAVSFVKNLRAQGVRNINVGLMQLNVPSHINKFKTLDDMLDLSHNIHFSAKLLSRLYQNYGSWSKAVERYKSSFCEESRRYQQYVYSMKGRVRNHRMITLDGEFEKNAHKKIITSKKLTHWVAHKRSQKPMKKKYEITTSPWTLCAYQHQSLLGKLAPPFLHSTSEKDAHEPTMQKKKNLSKKILEASLTSLAKYARTPSWGQTLAPSALTTHYTSSPSSSLISIEEG